MDFYNLIGNENFHEVHILEMWEEKYFILK